MALSKDRGLTLIEILTAVFSLSIVVLFVFSVYFPAWKLKTFERNEFEAHAEGMRWLEEVRATVKYDELYETPTSPEEWIPINAINPGDPPRHSPLYEDFSTWSMASIVDNLVAEYVIRKRTDFGSPAPYKPPKQIKLRVTWQERAPVE